LLWRLINIWLFCSNDCRSWAREEKFGSDDCRSWPREEKINNHGCWGKHAHIPDNDYWGICLFHVGWTNFFCNYSYVVHGIYIYFSSSTEHCAWAIFNVMQLILVKIKWHIKWKYLIQKFHDICLSYYFNIK
jgi:hypothetical protein